MNTFTVMKNGLHYFFTVAVLLACVITASQCVNDGVAATDPRGKAYAGAASCKQCHQQAFASHLQTAHFAATATADDSTVLGNFSAGKNIFIYDSSLQVRLEKRDSGLFQVLYENNKEVLARRFDIAFGNRKGQTCLYWKDDNVYQLPVSYYTSVQNWGTSPGFSIMFPPEFSRMIGKNCFECHSSYVKSREAASTATANTPGYEMALEKMNPQTLVMGIDCERCHGPAAEHVNFHLKNPAVKKPEFIVTAASLSNQQKLDACAICHSGNDKEKLKPRFLFKPGDALADYFKEGSGDGKIDVHGNQYALLLQSKCYTASNNLNCITCHSPHTNAASEHTFYSAKCMSCHAENTAAFCTLKTVPVKLLKEDCTGCHMPQEPSGVIQFQLSNNRERFSYMYTNHHIAVHKSGGQ